MQRPRAHSCSQYGPALEMSLKFLVAYSRGVCPLPLEPKIPKEFYYLLGEVLNLRD